MKTAEVGKESHDKEKFY
uniref:Uncharacterized protein n=1 Tax=Rhizophora mucronata TaxID=61149 RepID=A0A2P2NBD6_RHIMU